ncbi:MAG: hypothetical protein H6Q90_2787 [Deltaproteobacteria bacterium]|nr:hypothetical protein [Deltaproteobacteria bacterium]
MERPRSDSWTVPVMVIMWTTFAVAFVMLLVVVLMH